MSDIESVLRWRAGVYLTVYILPPGADPTPSVRAPARAHLFCEFGGHLDGCSTNTVAIGCPEGTRSLVGTIIHVSSIRHYKTELRDSLSLLFEHATSWS